MPTTLTNGIQLPDKGSVDWYSSMQSNYNLIDTHLGDTDTHVTAEDKANWNSKQGSLSQAQLDAIAQVATNTSDIASLQSGKANASHTHSSSDITDIDDYATKDYVDNSISGLVDNAPAALDTLNELSAALNDDANFASTVTTALAAKANSADLATVATTGSYNDLSNKPTINDSTITIQKNGSTVDTFTTNGSNKTINIPVPTKTSDLTNDSNFVVSSNLATVATSGDYDDLSNKPSIPTNTSDLNNDSGFVTLNDFDIPAKTSDLTNDSGFITSSDVPIGTSDLINDSNFVDTSNPAVASGITSAKVTDYDAHIADTDIHVTTADKNRWNNNTYVLRYSSTTLVASSTNSNSLLDNTDNLKVGDKVIDSSGVIYSITAIDTANSTFTIGTALIDLAQDSDVVHKSGNETVGGQKTFTNSIILQNSDTSGLSRDLFSKSQVAVLGDAVSGDNTKYRFVDKNDNEICYIRQRKLTNSNTDMSFCVNNIDNDNNSISAEINFVIDRNNEPRISPSVTDSISLGRPTFRWKSIYSNSYYYGNVEFSTKFVTTDTAQTISGNKTFLDVPISFKSSTAELGVTGGNTKVIFTDKNLLNLAGITFGNYGSSKLSYCRFSIYDKDSNNQEIENFIEFSYVNNNQVAYFRPNRSNFVTLGTINNRWNKVYADEYYYGTNNTPFSDKFVTTDTAQTVSGSKTFSDNLTIYNSDDTQTPKGLVIRNVQWGMGESGGTTVSNINFLDKNSSIPASVMASKGLYGQSFLRFSVRTKDSQNSTYSEEIYYDIDTSGNVEFRSWHDNIISLGTSAYKWKDVQTYQINGLEPSSLSLPSSSGTFDISSYITDLTGVNVNTYTPLANGYIVITCDSNDVDYIKMSNNLNFVSVIDNTNNQFTSGILGVWQPCIAGLGIQIRIKSSALKTARFIPCQGNV